MAAGHPSKECIIDKQQEISAVFGFFNEIGIISQLSGNAFEKAMPDGMTLAQFSVLNHLCRVGDGWTPQRIARAIQVTKGAMTGTLKHLESKGLIVVVPDAKDRRSKRVTICDEGRAMREGCVAALAPVMQALMEDIAPEDIAAAIPLLTAVRVWLDKQRSEPPGVRDGAG